MDLFDRDEEFDEEQEEEQSEDWACPRIALNWHFDAIQQFAQRANAIEAGAAALPVWLSTAPPNVTGAKLIDDIVAHLAEVSEEPTGHVLLYPTNLTQFCDVITRLGEIEAHPFMQQIARSGPATDRIADIAFTVFKKGSVIPELWNRRGPVGVHQLFA